MPGRAPCGLLLSTQEQGLGKFLRVCAIKNYPVKGNIKWFTRACLLKHLHLMARVPIQLLINLFGVPVVPAPFSRMLDNLNYSCVLFCPAPLVWSLLAHSRIWCTHCVPGLLIHTALKMVSSLVYTGSQNFLRTCPQEHCQSLFNQGEADRTSLDDSSETSFGHYSKTHLNFSAGNLSLLLLVPRICNHCLIEGISYQGRPCDVHS